MTDTARIIAALVGELDAGLLYYRANDDWGWRCAHCTTHHYGDIETFDHAPDCPILAGRAWLAAQQAEAGDG